MTNVNNVTRRTALFVTLATAGLVAFAAQASAAQALKHGRAAPAGFTAGEQRQTVTPVPCNSVSFCNQIIAYCAEKGGTWIESSHDGQGRPSSGTCYLD
jgi:putative hemolysin